MLERYRRMQTGVATMTADKWTWEQKNTDTDLKRGISEERRG